jgi:hypothetical protein
MTARILIADLERVPMWTKPLPVWDMKGLTYRRLSPNEIAEWGRTICLAYRWGTTGPIEFISEWQAGGREGYLAAVKELLIEADVFVGHNSKGFDVPHLKGDLLMAGMGTVPEIKHIDTLLMARKHANWEANHLDTLTKRLGIPAKTDKYRIDVAQAAVNGDVKMQQKIERYNRGDVRASTGLLKALLPLVDINLGLFTDDPTKPSCTACGSRKIQRRGTAVKAALRYPRYQCSACGKWMTSKTAIPGSVTMRPMA